MSEPNVAVLIDYENVGGDTLGPLFDQVSDVGRVIVKRAYADWSQVGERAREQLLDVGIEAIQNFHARGSAKNSSDISLAIDAVELLHSSPVEVFVILSADSDFVPLVRKLRAGGKQVIGAGRRAAVSLSLVKSCDRYIFLEEVKRAAQSAREVVIPQETQGVVIRAIDASSDKDGKVLGSRLHLNILHIDPGFDFKSLGFRTFAQFLRACNGVKVTKPKGPGDVVVELL